LTNPQKGIRIFFAVTQYFNKNGEVEEVLNSFKNDPCFGLDGWPMEFFFRCYEVLGKDLLRVLEDSRTNGRVLANFNSTFIALIPKSDNLDSFEKYKPISLLYL
jgi:hypothetical protein